MSIKITIELPNDQAKHLAAVAEYYECDSARAIEIILHDELYEMSKCINEDGIYEPQ